MAVDTIGSFAQSGTFRGIFTTGGDTAADVFLAAPVATSAAFVALV